MNGGVNGTMICDSQDCLVIGIDPGFKGAVATLLCDRDANGVQLLNVVSCPTYTIKRKVTRMDRKAGVKKTKQIKQCVYATSAMFTILFDLCHEHIFTRAIYAVIEKAQPMADQGVASTFITGVGFGYWEMALIALNIPYMIPTPAAWAREAFMKLPDDITGKDRTRYLAKQRFPDYNFVGYRRRLADDGWCDAVNLAYYGYEQRIWDLCDEWVPS